MPQAGPCGTHSRDFLKQYNRLRSRLPQQAVVSTPSNATVLYQQGMQAAATRDAAKWEAVTTRRRMKVAQEFCSFLSALPAKWCLTMETASPIDIIVFSETAWAHHTEGLGHKMGAE